MSTRARAYREDLRLSQGRPSLDQQVAGTMLDLATTPRARQNASPASHEAASRAKRTAAYWRRLALQLYAGGLELTPDEMSARIDWAHERSIKPRISNLLQEGCLKTTGVRRSFSHGEHRRGPGDVLRVTQAGEETLRAMQGDV